MSSCNLEHRSQIWTFYFWTLSLALDLKRVIDRFLPIRLKSFSPRSLVFLASLSMSCIEYSCHLISSIRREARFSQYKVISVMDAAYPLHIIPDSPLMTPQVALKQRAQKGSVETLRGDTLYFQINEERPYRIYLA